MNDGTLLELVSRGKKDSYFIQEARRSWFGSDYEKRSPCIRDITRQPTVGPVRFGGWVDIELPRGADIITDVQLRIQMPTWLPPRIAELNRTGAHKIEVESNTPGVFLRYGWTNGVANYLVERWALYADNLKLQEGWGDFNGWYIDMETTHAHAPIFHEMAGLHEDTPEAIQAAATPPELAFRVPIAGCQGLDDVGLPIVAIKGQRLYMRFWLRPLAQLVSSSTLPLLGGLPEWEVCPTPWGGRRIKVDDVLVDDVTLREVDIGPPHLFGRFSVLQVSEELRDGLRNSKQELLFRQQQRENFMITDTEWNPPSRIRRRLEIQGFFQALFIGFLLKARALQNRYRDINPPGDIDWVENLSLYVNATERVYPWPPKKFKSLANFTQIKRDVDADLYFLIFGVNPYREPAGPLNLTRTTKADLFLEVANILRDPIVPERDTYVSVVGLSWNALTIEGGRAVVTFPE